MTIDYTYRVIIICSVNDFNQNHLTHFDSSTMPTRSAAQAQELPKEDDCSSLSYLREKRNYNDVPTQEQIEKFELPDGYRIKFRKLCDNSSLTVSEFIEVLGAMAHELLHRDAIAGWV